MDSPGWLTVLFGSGFAAAALTLGVGFVRDWRGGNLRKGRSEAEQAELAVDVAEAAAPISIDGMRIDQVGDLQVIQGRALLELGAQLTAANARVAERDLQLSEADQLVASLRAAVRERDRRVDELELRLGHLEDELTACRRIIDDLRASPRIPPIDPDHTG